MRSGTLLFLASLACNTKVSATLIFLRQQCFYSLPPQYPLGTVSFFTSSSLTFSCGRSARLSTSLLCSFTSSEALLSSGGLSCRILGRAPSVFGSA